MKRGRESDGPVVAPKRAKESNEEPEKPVVSKEAKDLGLEAKDPAEEDGPDEETEETEETKDAAGEDSKDAKEEEKGDTESKKVEGSEEESKLEESELEKSKEESKEKSTEESKPESKPDEPKLKESKLEAKKEEPENTRDAEVQTEKSAAKDVSKPSESKISDESKAKKPEDKESKPAGFSSFSKGFGSFGSFGKFSATTKSATNPWSESSKSNPWAESTKSSPAESAKPNPWAESPSKPNPFAQRSEPAEEDINKEGASEDVYAQVKLEKQDVKTGEEDEDTVFQCRVRLYVIDLTSKDKAWKERGVGTLKLNLRDKAKYRLVLRADSVLKVILNLPLVPKMQVVKGFESSLHTDKFVRIAGLEDGKAHQFALRCASEAVRDELYDAVDDAIQE